MRALGAPQRDVAPDHDYAPDADAATPAVWKFEADVPPNYMTGLTMTPAPGIPAAVEVEPPAFPRRAIILRQRFQILSRGNRTSSPWR